MPPLEDPDKPRLSEDITPLENEEESLDPKNWETMRSLAHRMVDDAVNYLQTLSEGPVWQAMPDAHERHFSSSLPQHPSPPEAVYEEFLNNIFPYPMGNTHPRFWAWYMGNGTFTGAMADFLAAIMNSNAGGGNHITGLVEEQVLSWMKELVGFPENASGLLVTGASMANLVGLTVARNTLAGFDVRQHGLLASTKPLVVYASSEIHSCNQKAVELLGLGNQHLRRIPVSEDYRMDMAALQKTIDDDRACGLQPLCIIGTSGTVNTGAIDPLNEIADLCAKEGLWFHIDGAIGAVAMLADTVREQLAGLERADSIALDLHKWMHIPFEAGCALVRNRSAHRESFTVTPEYLARETRGLAAGREWFSDYGVELSRSFRALKIWMSLKEHGAERYGRLMARNVAQARYLGALIDQTNELELMAPIGLDIVCFRYCSAGLDENELESLNRRILADLQEQGIAAPSYTTLRGKYCLRVAIANHRSTQEDFDILIREILRLGSATQNRKHGS